MSLKDALVKNQIQCAKPNGALQKSMLSWKLWRFLTTPPKSDSPVMLVLSTSPPWRIPLTKENGENTGYVLILIFMASLYFFLVVPTFFPLLVNACCLYQTALLTYALTKQYQLGRRDLLATTLSGELGIGFLTCRLNGYAGQHGVRRIFNAAVFAAILAASFSHVADDRYLNYIILLISLGLYIQFSFFNYIQSFCIGSLLALALSTTPKQFEAQARVVFIFVVLQSLLQSGATLVEVWAKGAVDLSYTLILLMIFLSIFAVREIIITILWRGLATVLNADRAELDHLLFNRL